jgi:hypothetical protein
MEAIRWSQCKRWWILSGDGTGLIVASQGKGSKIKGSSFERKIAKQLTKWWQNGGLQGEFYRTPASGGLRWQNREDTIGDLVCPDGFTHTIEVKHNESLDYKHFFEVGTPNKNNLSGWWQQAVDEGKRANRLVWLIVKRNFCKPLLLFSLNDKKTYQYYSEVTQFVTTRFNVDLALSKHSGIGIYFLEEFLETADPTMFLDSK